MQMADASLIVVADRLSLSTVFTLDRKDFGFLKKADDSVLQIVPA